MEFSTVGKTQYPGLEVLIRCDSEKDPVWMTQCKERFRLLFVMKGTGIMKLGESRVLFHAPSVFYINETEEAVLEEQAELETKTVYLHPSAVQVSFTFDNIREFDKNFSDTVREDVFCLFPFFDRTSTYFGYMDMGLLTAKRMETLYDQLEQELRDQRDWFWPCRSRSFLMELLFLVERLYFQPEERQGVQLDSQANDMDRVLMYLHSNYNKKITLENLTKQFNINRTTLNQQFGRIVGMPVMTYLIQHRIKLASMFLRDTLLPVTEVADRVGFGDVTHFNRTFRKYTLHAPSDYRQQNCWMA